MRNSFTPEEFERLMEPWDPAMKEIALERMRTNFSVESLREFSPEEAVLMEAILKRLIPQNEGVDLVGFLDQFASNKLGRGDKRQGIPDGAELIHLGLQGVQEIAQSRHGEQFQNLGPELQDGILREIQEGTVSGGVWDQIPADQFFLKFYNKALHGYFAHPRVWMRIGFMGASYPEGYRWLGKGQVRQRHERAIGWEIM